MEVKVEKLAKRSEAEDYSLSLCLIKLKALKRTFQGSFKGFQFRCNNQ